MIFFVYRLTFSNGKVYIGMSKTDAKGLCTKRFREHERSARSGSKNPVHFAWRKHGAPTQTILSRHATREECAAAEMAAIQSHKALNPAVGYNLAAGGEGLNAPSGSRIHALMREKVWGNPERCAKISAALKGRPVCAESLEGFKAWIASPHGREQRRQIARDMWSNPEHRATISERTKLQMTPEARAHLSHKHAGRDDPRTPEGKSAAIKAQIAFANSPAGKEACRKGHAAMWANPENRAKVKAGTDQWRASDRNKAQCKEMAKRAAAICARRVRDVATGIEYESQRAMAQALGVSDSAISYRVKAGTVARI